MDFQTYTKIFKIFVSKGWTTEHVFDVPLDNICELATNLNEKEAELLIGLIERYSWLSANKYNGLIVSTLKKIEKERIEKCNKIYLFPMRKPSDAGKIKSGDSLAYNIKGSSAFVTELKDIEIEILSNFSDLGSLTANSNRIILLVDDFLGSGNTFKKCFDQICDVNPSIVENLSVFAVAIHNDALQRIESLKLPIYYGHCEKKGISDYYNKEDALSKIDLMKKIEKRLKINSLYSLGYEESEALITLIRTPNNTFPIFWDDYEVKGEKKKGPFPRY